MERLLTDILSVLVKVVVLPLTACCVFYVVACTCRSVMSAVKRHLVSMTGVVLISVDDAQTMTEEDFKTNTVFYCYPASMNQPTIPLLVRGAHLALGIPALARPTGGTSVFPVLNRNSNCNLDHVPTQEDEEDENATSFGLSRPNGWPTRFRWEDRWLHSDMRDVAYFYNFKFYDKVVETGALK